MKKIFTLTLLLLIIGVGCMKAANEIYGFFSTDGTKMTIYYDGKRNSRTGGTAALEWWSYSYASYRQNVTKIYVNSNVSDARPTSTAEWFAYFKNAMYIYELYNLNTSEVTSMRRMFCESPKLTLDNNDLLTFNTAKVQDCSYMFKECSALTFLDLGTWDFSSVTTMESMFESCEKLNTVWLPKKTGNVKDFNSMFAFCEALEKTNLDNLDTHSATNLYAMLLLCSKLKEADVSKWKTDNVENMSALFYGCESLTELDVDSFNTAKVREFTEMFYDCSNVTMLDLRSFDFSSTKALKDMFSKCSSLKKIYCDKDLSKISGLPESGRVLFTDCTSLITDNGTAFDNSEVGIDRAHLDGSIVNPGYFTMDRKIYEVFDNVNTLTFYFDEKIVERDGTDYKGNYPSLITSNVTNVVLDASMDKAYPASTKKLFANLKAVTAFPSLDYLHTDNVTDMSGMFSGCAKLQNVDIRRFEMGRVQNVSEMFKDCRKLRQILCADNWNEFGIASADDIFTNCQSIVGSHSTAFDAEKTGIEYARPDNAPSEPGYFWKDETDIKNVQSDKVQSTKVLRDGVLLIERGGKVFNAQGTEL